MADEWDDLFAKASGQDVNEEVAVVPDEEKPKKKRKRKKKSRKDGSFQEMLAGRLKVPGEDTAWPEWTRLGGNMIGTKECKCWEDSRKQDIKKKRVQCANCGSSPLHHKLLEPNEQSASVVWPLQMFCVIRNLRCVGIMVAMSKVTPHHLAKAARNETDLLRQHVTGSLSSLPAGEAEILGTKCQNIMDNSNVLFSQRKPKLHVNNGMVSPLLFEDAIRLIVACDDVYYRLYYLQISKSLPRDSNHDSMYLPHPAEYFHVPFLAWVGMDSDSARWKEFLEFVCSRRNECSRDYDQERLGKEIAARYGVDPFNINQQPECTDVLSYLHHNRAMETARLFYTSGWMATQEAREQTKTALEKPVNDRGLSRHETPAPLILAEWRDSCRDKLCNLYAYATLSDGAVTRIKNNVVENVGLSGGIIEMGAGTGYLAAMLRRAVIATEAWDVCPPGRSKNLLNEYHGITPSFYEISRGGASTLRQNFPAWKADMGVALLLCYPPPETRMAYDALHAYKIGGGRCLVHIGEFCGLTGSPTFEDCLVESFYCVDRFPCLSWGTDAADITIWRRADDKQVEPEDRFLLPCSSCGKAEASKRCRLVRHVAYCGESCFEEHAPALIVHLAMNMIPNNAETLDFDDDRHFVPIRLWKTTGGKTKANEKRKLQ